LLIEARLKRHGLSLISDFYFLIIQWCVKAWK
jgi:hypothetical protein